MTAMKISGSKFASDVTDDGVFPPSVLTWSTMVGIRETPTTKAITITVSLGSFFLRRGLYLHPLGVLGASEFLPTPSRDSLYTFYLTVAWLGIGISAFPEFTQIHL